MDDLSARKPLLSVGELHERTGVGKTTIRHWEREFQDFLNAARTKGNQRRFPPDAVEKIEKIKHLVEEQGLTLKGVRKQLEQVTGEEMDGDSAPDINLDNAERLADLMTDHLLRRLIQDL